jgi:hypothetical protein
MVGVAGCRGPRPGAVPADGSATAQAQEFSPEEKAVRKTMRHFLLAFQDENAEECLAVLAPDLRERYGEAFRDRTAFVVTGKSGQAILVGSDRVAVDEIDGDRARGHYYSTPAADEGMRQVGMLPVALRRIDGTWLISEINLGLQASSPERQQRTAH